MGFASRLHWTRVWYLQVGPSWPGGLVTAFVCYDTHCVCGVSLGGVEGARSAGDERRCWRAVILVLPGCWIPGGRSCALVRYRSLHIPPPSTLSVVGWLVPMSCPSGGTIVLTHVSSHVLLQQKPVAPRELWLSSWQVYEQQEAEVVQGSQQGE